MTTVRELLTQGTRRIQGVDSARLDCEILLAKALGVDRAHLFAHPEDDVVDGHADTYERLLSRREAGEPVAYITGEREFWSLPLRVTPDVLIPRPETEVLVERALQQIPADRHVRIADLGTGSGAIALAVARERPQSEVHASDISEQALDVARHNASALGISNVTFHHGSWFEPLSGEFGVVLSNPPYIAAGDPHLSRGDLRFEPETALVSRPDALSAAREVIADAPPWLVPGGWLILEHSFCGGMGARRALGTAGFRKVETLRDQFGHERVTLGTLP